MKFINDSETIYEMFEKILNDGMNIIASLMYSTLVLIVDLGGHLGCYRQLCFEGKLFFGIVLILRQMFHWNELFFMLFYNIDGFKHN